ncbi:hypothetical protein BOCO_0194 [Bombiscardovia coagulans]|uniref:Uncharacterized protein n=2 Tax=Bombiscardovia coagulans TaxID=686666 RepID=A0A261EUP7_9BIFI|nr:hypothetical protein BOCO_0194 [Bombiscardovia coagulans]
MSASDQRIHFSLDIPSDWECMELSRQGRRKYAQQKATEVVEKFPSLSIYQKKLEDTLYKELTSSWSMGVRYGASMSTPTTDGLLSASVTVSVLPEPPRRDDISTFDAIVATIHENDDESQGDDESDISQVVLPQAGKAIRVLGHRVFRPNGVSKAVPYSVFQTYLPYAGRVVLVMGMTFCTDVEDLLFELFELITSTLTVWIDGGDH